MSSTTLGKRLNLYHELALYAVVLLSTMTIAFSSLTPLVIGLFFAAFVGSWFWHRRGLGDWVPQTVWNALVLGTVALTGAQMYLDENRSAIDIGVQFIVLLVMVKLFSRQGERDDWQIYALTLLLMASGTAVNEDITYGLVFAAYVIIGTFGLAMFHLVVEDRRRQRHTTRSPMARIYMVALALLAGSVFMSSVSIFFVFPRVGLGFFAKQSRPSQSSTGFSDTVELGSHGVIRDNPQVALRVYFPGNRPPGDVLHWKMRSFDLYDGTSWKRTRKQHLSFPYGRKRGEFAIARGKYRPRLRSLVKAQPDANTITIYTEPLGTTHLPTVWPTTRITANPDTVNIPFNPRRVHVAIDRYGDLHYKMRNELGLFYQLTYKKEPSERDLRAAMDLKIKPKPDSRYLQLPEGMDRLKALAKKVAEGTSDPYGKAKVIQGYLEANYKYTTNLPKTEGDPVEAFLFTTKRGHCEFFATSMALMLRAVGVEARIVNGFLGGQWNGVGGYLAVRQGDAHSWVEVHLPGLGWVPFDPTPAASQPQANQATQWFRQTYDSMRMAWVRWVVEYDLERQIAGLRSIGRTFAPKSSFGKLSGSKEKKKEERDKEKDSEDLRRAISLLGYLILCGVAYRQARYRGVRAMPPYVAAQVVSVVALAGWCGWWAGFELEPMGFGAVSAGVMIGLGIAMQRRLGEKRTGAEIASALFQQLEREAKRVGVQRPADHGPDRFIATLVARFPDARADLERFRARYLDARFGEGALTPDEERALSLLIRRIGEQLRQRG